MYKIQRGPVKWRELSNHMPADNQSDRIIFAIVLINSLCYCQLFIFVSFSFRDNFIYHVIVFMYSLFLFIWPRINIKI